MALGDRSSRGRRVRLLIRESASLHERSAPLEAEVLRVVDLFVDAFRRGHKVLLFGNGGSAADAQHIAAELVGRFRFDRPALPAIALTTNSSALTAIANDLSFENVFERGVDALAEKGDVVVALSTSGVSPNVLRGVERARRKGAKTVAFTGSGGRLRTRCDVALAVPSRDTPRIQEVHITLGHIVCELVEEALFATEFRRAGRGLRRPR